MPELEELDEGQERVQCPNCLGYFRRDLSPNVQPGDDSIERHLCWIGGTVAPSKG